MEVLYREIYKMKAVEARRRLVKTYEKTSSIRKTAKLWGTSRLVVRKWMRRYHQSGEKGLKDVSRRPKRCPWRTPLPIEEKVLTMRKEKGYGRRRIAWFLLREEKIEISQEYHNPYFEMCCSPRHWAISSNDLHYSLSFFPSR
ncbi:MAG: helix-turn-helix domain-containing protein [Candidatus Aerophobetes bacterium]